MKLFPGRRFRTFVPDYQSCRRILVIGGEHNLWSMIGRQDGITILNINIPAVSNGFTYVLGSGCHLPFANRSFDLAFSNSVIEQ